MPTLRKAGPAPKGPKLADKEGSILIFEPLAVKTVETDGYGTSEAVEAIVFVWDEKAKEPRSWDSDKALIFWRRVKAQLIPAIDTKEVVVGRLVKDGNAFVLADVDDATMEVIAKKLDEF